jgi:hypothetical protein
MYAIEVWMAVLLFFFRCAYITMLRRCVNMIPLDKRNIKVNSFYMIKKIFIDRNSSVKGVGSEFSRQEQMPPVLSTQDKRKKR